MQEFFKFEARKFHSLKHKKNLFWKNIIIFLFLKLEKFPPEI